MKKRLNKEKTNVNIKKKDKVLLLIKNFINDKLNNFYVKAFLIKEIKKVMTLLALLNMKIFLKFYTFLLKKVL